MLRASCAILIMLFSPALVSSSLPRLGYDMATLLVAPLRTCTNALSSGSFSALKWSSVAAEKSCSESALVRFMPMLVPSAFSALWFVSNH